MVEPETKPSEHPGQPAPGTGSSGARVAIAHDWLVGLRGGELVLDRLCRLVRDHHDPAGLFTMFDDGRPLTGAIDAMPRTVSSLNRLPPAWRRWLLFRYPAAVRELEGALALEHGRRPIDLLVSTSSAAVKGIRPPGRVPHVCYCHAPARYLWGQQEAYARGSLARRAGLALFGPSLRRWDARTAANVTTFIANSTHTAREIERVYGREATVVHPPARTVFFTPGDPAERGDFWLVVSALEPYKRVDLAIEAAAIARTRLVIAGAGSQSARLRAAARAAGAKTEFLGRVSDERLRDLYRRARLFVFPQVEDFGITAVEAQACGCPVVARRAGGALDTVTADRTGSLFDEPTPGAITRAAAACPADQDACRANAERFSERAFDDAMRATVAHALATRGA